ncbi:MAG TPA: class I SAM-dependent methyltransferase [Thermoanaerobaculia bacterium]|nr:class I SAM-dependent methyltransferase [Thermoanaerobaculia bacterium]
MSPSPAPQKPDYGIDAPGVVRNLFLVTAAGIVLWATVAFGLWTGRLSLPLGRVRLDFPLATMGLWSAAGCGFMGVWMLWSSKTGKVRERERFLDRISWTGNEQVLDVGCGRGLLLIGAAKRLTGGKATGIDLWQAEDLSGNRPEATLANAEREGVADRVEVKTADMRELPFPDETFDVVVSRAAIHNLYSAPDREKAIAQIARVLKPGGQALIDDIRHQREYVASFAKHHCTDVHWLSSPVLPVAVGLITMGSLYPAAFRVRKEGIPGGTRQP